MKNSWYKKEDNNNIWWKDVDSHGEFIFSFDKKKEFNLFRDYPFKLTKKEKEIFDNENEFWKDFFSDRK